MFYSPLFALGSVNVKTTNKNKEDEISDEAVAGSDHNTDEEDIIQVRYQFDFPQTQ